MKIYFAGSIRGGREDIELYQEIINLLKNYGDVLTEHVAGKDLKITDVHAEQERIYLHDIELLGQCDFMVAEVTTPSLGVGYEIASFEGKPILCLVKDSVGKNLSSMISGNPNVVVSKYADTVQAEQIIDQFVKNL